MRRGRSLWRTTGRVSRGLGLERGAGEVGAAAWMLGSAAVDCGVTRGERRREGSERRAGTHQGAALRIMCWRWFRIPIRRGCKAVGSGVRRRESERRASAVERDLGEKRASEIGSSRTRPRKLALLAVQLVQTLSLAPDRLSEALAERGRGLRGDKEDDVAHAHPARSTTSRTRRPNDDAHERARNGHTSASKGEGRERPRTKPNQGLVQARTLSSRLVDRRAPSSRSA